MASSSGGKSQESGSSKRRASASRGAAANTASSSTRARFGATRSRSRGGTRPKPQPDPSVAEPTVTATDEVLAASNARRALSPDMPRVAWVRTQLQNMEAHRRERLTKAIQLTLILIVFVVFVLQNAEAVPVELLFFSLNIRLIWVIVGCGVLGGVAGYVIGRPEKSLSALLSKKDEKPEAAGTAGR